MNIFFYENRKIPHIIPRADRNFFFAGSYARDTPGAQCILFQLFRVHFNKI
jgi:hypothetical protein